MKKYTKEELQEVLRLHKLWLDGKDGGVRANLSYANLRNANLSYANLRYSNLSGSNLRYSNLSGSNLSNANLSGSDLRYSNLRYSNLSGSNLSDSDLSGSDLRGSNLSDSDLRRANLSDSDLRRANLRRANLDFSCLPLWCGSLAAQFDDRQLRQIAYHLVKAGLQSENASEAAKKELSKICGFANAFHRAHECGMIEWDGDTDDA